MRITNPEAVPAEAVLLMDTHVWLWADAADAQRLSSAVLALIEQAAQEQRLYASAASVWEIALKAAKGELLIGTDLRAWVASQQEAPGVRLLSITPDLGIDVTLLPSWLRHSDQRPHKDPSDRFIVASARRRNAILLTADSHILDYADDGHVVALDVR